MGKNIKRFWLLMTVCGLLGIVFGATTSQAAINQCIVSDHPSSDCLSKDPLTKRIEDMSTGLFVGIGSALGATWQARQKER